MLRAGGRAGGGREGGQLPSDTAAWSCRARLPRWRPLPLRSQTAMRACVTAPRLRCPVCVCDAQVTRARCHSRPLPHFLTPSPLVVGSASLPLPSPGQAAGPAAPGQHVRYAGGHRRRLQRALLRLCCCYAAAAGGEGGTAGGGGGGIGRGVSHTLSGWGRAPRIMLPPHQPWSPWPCHPPAPRGDSYLPLASMST